MLKAVLSRKDLSKLAEYYDCVRDLLESDDVKRLAVFPHHLGTSRFQHCLNVSYYNFLVCRRLKLDARAGARAGLLHDFFFYDRRRRSECGIKGPHASTHPKAALSNASAVFILTELEGEMIANHMWPLTKSLPRHRETYVITLVDKFCALAEIASAPAKKRKR